MHTVAANTDLRMLPDILAALVDRNERRRTQRARAWRRESALERVKLRINASPPPDGRRLRVSVAEPRTLATSANYQRAVDTVVPPQLCFTSCPWRSSDGSGEWLSSRMAQLGM
jgi:hypothetical protein